MSGGVIVYAVAVQVSLILSFRLIGMFGLDPWVLVCLLGCQEGICQTGGPTVGSLKAGSQGALDWYTGNVVVSGSA